MSENDAKPSPKIGDRINFSVTTRDGRKTVTRVVNGIPDEERVTVRFLGWKEFIVLLHEINFVEPREEPQA